jgi:hypothetical protein
MDDLSEPRLMEIYNHFKIISPRNCNQVVLLLTSGDSFPNNTDLQVSGNLFIATPL